jgi:hypothetical protein
LPESALPANAASGPSWKVACRWNNHRREGGFNSLT